MINILFIINDFKDLSINQRVLDIIKYINKAKFNPYILALNSHGSLKNKFKDIDQLKITTTKKNLLRNSIQTKDIIQRNKINIIYTQTLRPEYTTYIANFLLYISNSSQHFTHFSNRGYDFFTLNSFTHLIKNILYFFSLYFSEINIIVSKSLSQKLQNKFHISKNKIITIQNGVEIPQKQTKKKNNPPTITYAGRLIKEKNLFQLLNALKNLNQQKINFKCNIAGKGPEREKIIQYIKQNKLSQKIIIKGFIKNINNLLHKTDIFVLPSNNEGMSNSLLESMAHHCVCIVKNIPANTEIINHQQNGLIFNTTSELISQLNQTITNHQTSKKLSNKGYQTVLNNFNRSKMLQKYKKAFQKINF